MEYREVITLMLAGKTVPNYALFLIKAHGGFLKFKFG